jgi:hypothetical protein
MCPESKHVSSQAPSKCLNILQAHNPGSATLEAMSKKKIWLIYASDPAADKENVKLHPASPSMCVNKDNIYPQAPSKIDPKSSGIHPLNNSMIITSSV